MTMMMIMKNEKEGDDVDDVDFYLLFFDRLDEM